MELGEQRHQGGKLIGLQQDVSIIDRVAHRDGQLDLPKFHAPR
jgi:hypothetical protein